MAHKQRTPFTLKSGNKTSFKDMGSSSPLYDVVEQTRTKADAGIVEASESDILPPEIDFTIKPVVIDTSGGSSGSGKSKGKDNDDNKEEGEDEEENNKEEKVEEKEN
jgi:hypothetical protein